MIKATLVPGVPDNRRIFTILCPRVTRGDACAEEVKWNPFCFFKTRSSFVSAASLEKLRGLSWTRVELRFLPTRSNCVLCIRKQIKTAGLGCEAPQHRVSEVKNLSFLKARTFAICLLLINYNWDQIFKQKKLQAMIRNLLSLFVIWLLQYDILVTTP